MNQSSCHSFIMSCLFLLLLLLCPISLLRGRAISCETSITFCPRRPLLSVPAATYFYSPRRSTSPFVFPLISCPLHLVSLPFWQFPHHPSAWYVQTILVYFLPPSWWCSQLQLCSLSHHYWGVPAEKFLESISTFSFLFFRATSLLFWWPTSQLHTAVLV